MLLFGIIPIRSLFFLNLLSTLIISFLFYFPIKYLKGKKIKFFIILINIIFFFLLKEFSRVSLKTTIILQIITTIMLLLLYSKHKYLNNISKGLIITLTALSMWQGFKIDYKSNLLQTETQVDLNFYEYNRLKIVDSSKYYNGNSGIAKLYDKMFWGFTKNLPLNGRVYYPKKSGVFPIVFILHGNALAENPSHKGYDYLLKHLAANGFIAVSIDENFLNGNWTTLGQGQPKENDARAFLLLEHIKLFDQLNRDKSSIFYNMVDISNIGLVGHSRGGEAVSIAAKYSNYPIKAVMSLSGTDRQFRESINLTNISYIALHGANDGDLKSFKARSQFNRISFTNDSEYNIKATYYLEGVNHSQFNSDWGLIDSTSLGKLFYGRNNNLKAIDQREIAKELSLKLFRFKLLNVVDEVKYLKQPSLIPTLPNTVIITDFLSSNYKPINYNLKTEDIHKRSFYKNGKSTWDFTINYNSKIILNNKLDSISTKNIIFSLANSSNKELDLLVNVIKDNSVKEFVYKLEPGISKHIFKINMFSKEDRIDPNFQYFQIPIDNKPWDKIEINFKNFEGNILFNNFYYSETK